MTHPKADFPISPEEIGELQDQSRQVEHLLASYFGIVDQAPAGELRNAIAQAQRTLDSSRHALSRLNNSREAVQAELNHIQEQSPMTDKLIDPTPWDNTAYGRIDLTLDQYQGDAGNTKAYPDPGETLDLPIYTALKLAGEAGEVAEKVGKIMRDGEGEPTDADITALRAELGDVLWYVAMMADDLGLSLSDVAAANLEKLASRKARGTIQGSGDNR